MMVEVVKPKNQEEKAWEKRMCEYDDDLQEEIKENQRLLQDLIKNRQRISKEILGLDLEQQCDDQI